MAAISTVALARTHWRWRAARDRETVALRQRQWVLANATVEIAATALERIYEKYARPEICAQLV